MPGYNVSRESGSNLRQVGLIIAKCKVLKVLIAHELPNFTNSSQNAMIPPHRPGQAHHLERNHPGPFDASDVKSCSLRLSGRLSGILNGTRPPGPPPDSRPFVPLIPV
jgi:hypothetical protein